MDISIIRAPHIGILRRNVNRSPVTQDTDGIIRLTHNAGNGVRKEFQFLSGIDVGVGNIRISIAHQETLFACDGNRVTRIHGAQAEEIIIVHIFNEHILVGSRLCQITGQGNGQRLVRSANALLAAGEDQIVARDIGLVGIIQRIVDSLFGIQAHVAFCIVLRGINVAHVDGGLLTSCVLAARYENMAACLHVQRTASLDAQGQIALDLKGRQVAVCVLLDSNIRSAHIHELLHVFNAFVSGQLIYGNRGSRVIKGTYCTLGCMQGDVPAQYISCPLRQHTASAVGIHHLVTDGVKHHVLCPFKGGVGRLGCQILIGDVIRQIRIGISVLGIFIGSSVFQISIRRCIAIVLGILLRFLRIG